MQLSKDTLRHFRSNLLTNTAEPRMNLGVINDDKRVTGTLEPIRGFQIQVLQTNNSENHNTMGHSRKKAV